MSVVQTLSGAFAPWQNVYSNSKAIATIVTTVHIVALLVGGGLAIGADRTTLRALRHEMPDWKYHLSELHAVHRPVLAMIALLFVSGVALAAADIETFWATPYFWVKLGLVALLLVNGAFLYRTESQLHAGLNDALERRLRIATRLSMTLWILTAIAGTVLANAA